MESSEHNQGGSPSEASQGAVDEHGAQGVEPGVVDGGEAANPEREDANVGSQGEQVPVDATGASQSTPVAQSAPPADAQSGVPLEADRDAGVQPDPEAAGH